MKLITALGLAVFVAGASGASSASAQACPTGTYPWTDSWGNKICKRHGDGGTATVEARPGHTCPTGSSPWVDSWGNKVCRERGSGGRPATDS